MITAWYSNTVVENICCGDTARLPEMPQRALKRRQTNFRNKKRPLLSAVCFHRSRFTASHRRPCWKPSGEQMKISAQWRMKFAKVGTSIEKCEDALQWPKTRHSWPFWWQEIWKTSKLSERMWEGGKLLTWCLELSESLSWWLKRRKPVNYWRKRQKLLN